jgi:hypothetical protein
MACGSDTRLQNSYNSVGSPSHARVWFVAEGARHSLAGPSAHRGRQLPFPYTQTGRRRAYDPRRLARASSRRLAVRAGLTHLSPSKTSIADEIESSTRNEPGRLGLPALLAASRARTRLP